MCLYFDFSIDIFSIARYQFDNHFPTSILHAWKAYHFSLMKSHASAGLLYLTPNLLPDHPRTLHSTTIMYHGGTQYITTHFQPTFSHSATSQTTILPFQHLCPCVSMPADKTPRANPNNTRSTQQEAHTNLVPPCILHTSVRAIKTKPPTSHSVLTQSTKPTSEKEKNGGKVTRSHNADGKA